MKTIEQRVAALEKNSHPPIDLMPAVEEALSTLGYGDRGPLIGCLEKENAELREALQSIRNTAHGIMPIHEDMKQLQEIIISVGEATWTRLYTILATADKALNNP